MGQRSCVAEMNPLFLVFVDVCGVCGVKGVKYDAGNVLSCIGSRSRGDLHEHDRSVLEGC